MEDNLKRKWKTISKKMQFKPTAQRSTGNLTNTTTKNTLAQL